MILCFCKRADVEPDCSCSSITFEEQRSPSLRPPRKIVIEFDSCGIDSHSERSVREHATRDELLKELNGKNGQAVEKLIGSYKKGAHCVYKYRNSYESLLSLAILYRAPLQAVQAVYNANPSALKQCNTHGMSPLHLACTVRTSLDVMVFLIMELQKQQYRLVQLNSPGGWTAIHTACSVGLLPLDTFLYVLKHSTSMLGTVTIDNKSTPLHLALVGLRQKPSHEQLIMILSLVQSYPFAVEANNAANKNPIDIAKYMFKRGSLDNDIVEFLSDVQGLVQRKYTFTQIEERVASCRTVLSQTGNISDSNDMGGNNLFYEQVGIEDNRIVASIAGALFEKNSLIKAALAQIELQILLALKGKVLPEDESLVEKTVKSKDILLKNVSLEEEKLDLGEFLELPHNNQKNLWEEAEL